MAEPGLIEAYLIHLHRCIRFRHNPVSALRGK